MLPRLVQTAFALILLHTTLQAQLTPPLSPFVKGADLSLLQFVEDHGVKYQEDGKTKDALLIFKEHGCNTIRLRLFVKPDGTHGQVNTLAYTLAMAQRVKKAGLHLILDLHYSDVWADPGNQIIPAQWAKLSHSQLVSQVTAYTRETLDVFRRKGCSPDIVQVGNEIRNGMIWPDGGPLKTDAQWPPFTDLIKAGIRGVKESDPQGSIKIMIHIDQGGDKNTCRWFFDHLQKYDVHFDLIGLSYYPFWHGTLADLAANLASLSETYKKDIMVVETGYNFSGGEQGQLPFPPTPDGQKAFLEALIRTVAATPGGHGKGVLYWAPDWIKVDQWGGNGEWENRALFDHSGQMLPAMRAFEEPEKTAPTLPKNTTTNGHQ